MKRLRTYSRYAHEAAELLGMQIRQARRQRRWSAQDLADRVGVTRATLSKVERGDPSVGLGVAFEAATLVGVPLFRDDAGAVRSETARARDRLALLPQRVRERKGGLKDDF